MILLSLLFKTAIISIVSYFFFHFRLFSFSSFHCHAEDNAGHFFHRAISFRRHWYFLFRQLAPLYIAASAFLFEPPPQPDAFLRVATPLFTPGRFISPPLPAFITFRFSRRLFSPAAFFISIMSHNIFEAAIFYFCRRLSHSHWLISLMITH